MSSKVEVVSCRNVKGTSEKGPYDFNVCDLIITKDNGERIVGVWNMPKGSAMLKPGFFVPQFDLYSMGGQAKAVLSSLVPFKGA